MKVSVFGLGYVGTRVGGVVRGRRARRRRRRRQRDKVAPSTQAAARSSNRGSTSCSQRVVAQGRLRATTDTADAVRATDVSLLCVGTPSRKNGSLDLTYLSASASRLARPARQATPITSSSSAAPCCRGPRTTSSSRRSSARPARNTARASASRSTPSFCAKARRSRTSASRRSRWSATTTPPMPAATRRSIRTSMRRSISTSIRVAEMMKYTSNALHALKVVLRQRDRQPLQARRRRQPRGDGHLLPGRQAEPLVVLPQARVRVRRIVPAEGRPRAAVPREGSRPRAAADPVDPARSNRLQIEHAIDQVVDTGKKKIGLLGFSFKAGTDDLRESPMVILAEALLGKGYQLRIYDRNVSLARAGRREQAVHRGADPSSLVAALRHRRRSDRQVRGRRRRQRGAGVRAMRSKRAGRIRSSSTWCGCRSRGPCWPRTIEVSAGERGRAHVSRRRRSRARRLDRVPGRRCRLLQADAGCLQRSSSRHSRPDSRAADDGQLPRGGRRTPLALHVRRWGRQCGRHCRLPRCVRMAWTLLRDHGLHRCPGFLTRGDIRALRARGHVVGSHSCTHPLRMAGCSSQRIQDEWSRSVAALADILGERIDTASVPGGDHSPRVADAAAAAGVRVLFTSRPTIAVQVRDDLLVVGRFAVRRSTSPARAAAVAAGASTPRLAQMLLWDLKAIGKAVAGPTYRRLRARRFGGSDRVRWGDDLAGV